MSVLCSLGESSTPDFVFKTVTSGTSGWSYPGVCFNLGPVATFLLLTGSDGVLHMSKCSENANASTIDETKNPRKRVPEIDGELSRRQHFSHAFLQFGTIPPHRKLWPSIAVAVSAYRDISPTNRLKNRSDMFGPHALPVLGKFLVQHRRVGITVNVGICKR